MESQDLTLPITFDRHPEEVHWVIVSSEMVPAESGRSRVDRRILVFGPETKYDESLSQTKLEIPLEVSVTNPSSSQLKFILTDTAGGGLCCRYGAGSYEIYDDERSLLASGNAKGKGREVVSFSLLKE